MEDWNPNAPRTSLRDLSQSQRDELDAMVRGNPLAAFNTEKTLLVVIRPFDRSRNLPPDPGATDFRMGLEYVSESGWGYYVLPLTPKYESVALTGHHDHGDEVITIKTDRGDRLTNRNEMNRKLRIAVDLPESELLARFEDLTNGRVVRKPVTATRIESGLLGVMKQDEQFDDWWEGKPLAIPLLGGEEVTVQFTGLDPDVDLTFVADADAALTRFLALTDVDRAAAATPMLENCRDFLEDVLPDFDREEWPEAYAMLEIQDPMEIWSYVHPETIYVLRSDKAEGHIFIKLTCECDWEEEHGLQLIYRDGEMLTRVSEQDGHLFD